MPVARVIPQPVSVDVQQRVHLHGNASTQQQGITIEDLKHRTALRLQAAHAQAQAQGLNVERIGTSSKQVPVPQSPRSSQTQHHPRPFVDVIKQQYCGPNFHTNSYPSSDRRQQFRSPSNKPFFPRNIENINDSTLGPRDDANVGLNSSRLRVKNDDFPHRQQCRPFSDDADDAASINSSVSAGRHVRSVGLPHVNSHQPLTQHQLHLQMQMQMQGSQSDSTSSPIDDWRGRNRTTSCSSASHNFLQSQNNSSVGGRYHHTQQHQINPANSSGYFVQSSPSRHHRHGHFQGSWKPSLRQHSHESLPSKLPHGLTVQELKEMTRARLASEVGSSDKPSDASGSDSSRRLSGPASDLSRHGDLSVEQRSRLLLRKGEVSSFSDNGNEQIVSPSSGSNEMLTIGQQDSYPDIRKDDAALKVQQQQHHYGINKKLSNSPSSHHSSLSMVSASASMSNQQNAGNHFFTHQDSFRADRSTEEATSITSYNTQNSEQLVSERSLFSSPHIRGSQQQKNAVKNVSSNALQWDGSTRGVVNPSGNSNSAGSTLGSSLHQMLFGRSKYSAVNHVNDSIEGDSVTKEIVKKNSTSEKEVSHNNDVHYNLDKMRSFENAGIDPNASPSSFYNGASESSLSLSDNGAGHPTPPGLGGFRNGGSWYYSSAAAAAVSSPTPPQNNNFLEEVQENRPTSDSLGIPMFDYDISKMNINNQEEKLELNDGFKHQVKDNSLNSTGRVSFFCGPRDSSVLQKGFFSLKACDENNKKSSRLSSGSFYGNSMDSYNQRTNEDPVGKDNTMITTVPSVNTMSTATYGSGSFPSVGQDLSRTSSVLSARHNTIDEEDFGDFNNNQFAVNDSSLELKTRKSLKDEWSLSTNSLLLPAPLSSGNRSKSGNGDLPNWVAESVLTTPQGDSRKQLQFQSASLFGGKSYDPNSQLTTNKGSVFRDIAVCPAANQHPVSPSFVERNICGSESWGGSTSAVEGSILSSLSFGTFREEFGSVRTRTSSADDVNQPWSLHHTTSELFLEGLSDHATESFLSSGNINNCSQGIEPSMSDVLGDSLDPEGKITNSTNWMQDDLFIKSTQDHRSTQLISCAEDGSVGNYGCNIDSSSSSASSSPCPSDNCTTRRLKSEKKMINKDKMKSTGKSKREKPIRRADNTALKSN